MHLFGYNLIWQSGKDDVVVDSESDVVNAAPVEKRRLGKPHLTQLRRRTSLRPLELMASRSCEDYFVLHVNITHRCCFPDGHDRSGFRCSSSCYLNQAVPVVFVQAMKSPI